MAGPIQPNLATVATVPAVIQAGAATVVAAVVEIKGGCHCGAVRFHAEVPAAVELLDCNCSICSATGFLHLIVPHVDFALENGDNALTSYRFGTGTANHLFCSICGVKSFYQPRSHPDCWSINFNCVDPGHPLQTNIRAFDGRSDWEASHKAMDAG